MFQFNKNVFITFFNLLQTKLRNKLDFPHKPYVILNLPQTCISPQINCFPIVTKSTTTFKNSNDLSKHWSEMKIT